jgi:hypothetical protein
MDQNIAQEYYKDEYQRTKKERPWLYWVILGVAAVVMIILIYTVGQ